jgi:site-specific recombinase XerD
MRGQGLASLNRADIQDGHSFEGLMTGKGDKEWLIFFDEEARAAIRAYLVARADTYQPVFLRHDDGRGKLVLRGEHWRLSPLSVWGA